MSCETVRTKGATTATRRTRPRRARQRYGRPLSQKNPVVWAELMGRPPQSHPLAMTCKWWWMPHNTPSFFFRRLKGPLDAPVGMNASGTYYEQRDEAMKDMSGAILS